ncbi:LLM class flavin-dependent oxidoreductase [Paraburkholderia unamae]|uniref:Alkanesulfonate monooxygenase SsuD/methylene tetrahydromethanopterin reductase-like flavin-dependent oxidoreductase (Luciferase family) n=1 Tax=Paraburkholderia unamae TaxID=219649 RepID=A0ABX5KTZ9_9BURK|nr:LLM class flavin-dependent oxidoreductase [Paraburkholderia unamae]PVX85456.1 alkanesulfonate monooxygenase SsuD/methylene tetrahydromethanopterin reductase-like flavin-dependent oxidoreductase (luciferase family) [Paraburkholderia unamae]
MKLRLGTLCLFENPTGEDGRALIRQFVLAREADRMGYDDVWLVERHGDASRPSGAITTLLGHLSGVTSKARVGAVLLPEGRHGLQLAEDLATVELLSRGRLALAVDAQDVASADAVLDSLDWLRARLDGGHHDNDLIPRPSGERPLAWALTADVHVARSIAARGFGLCLPPDLPLDAVSALLSHYRDAVPENGDGARPMPLLVRYACPAETHDEALAIATLYLNARVGVEHAGGVLAHSLVGNHAEVAAQIRGLGAELGLYGILIIPMSAHFDTAKHILADMVDEVRPLLDD